MRNFHPVENRPRHRPIATFSLIGLNLAISAVVAYLSFRDPHRYPKTLYTRFGLSSLSRHPLSLITYMFLHDGIAHLAGNLLFLGLFGADLEEAVGGWLFLLVFFSAGLISGLFPFALSRAAGDISISPLIGASGAIAGVIGFYAIRFYRARIQFIGLTKGIPALLLVAAYLLAEVAVSLWRLSSGAGSPIPDWTHLIGFIWGILLATILQQERAGRGAYLESDARRELEQGSLGAAVHRWERVLHHHPEHESAHFELAKAWALLGDHSAAAGHFLSGMQQLSKSHQREWMARRYIEFQRFAGDAPLPAELLYEVSCTLEQMGECATAAKAYDDLVARHPDCTECEMALLKAGTLYAGSIGDRALAENRLTHFLERYPNSALRHYAEELLKQMSDESIPPPHQGE